MGDVGVWHVMICNIAKQSFNCMTSGQCHICESGNTGRGVRTLYIDSLNHTLES
jgi:hypothetical protein